MTNNIDEKLKETIYHEYFHAVECTYNRNTNSTFGEASSDWFASSCSGFSSISAGHLKDYMRLSYKCILDHNEEYGVSCFLFAIQKAYGGTKVVRKICIRSVKKMCSMVSICRIFLQRSVEWKF